MKKILFIKSIKSLSLSITMILIACNVNTKSKDTKLDNNTQRDLFIIKNITSDTPAIKRILTKHIKKITQTARTLMEQHTKDLTQKSEKQLGIQCTIFDEIYYDTIINNKEKKYTVNKNKIKLSYASLNYKITRLKWLGEILLQIQKDNTKQGNELYNAIIETGREYNQKPFEEIIHQIHKEQNKIILLKSEKLKEIIENLNIIENLRMIWIKFVDIIIEDYRMNTDIQNNNIKLIEHIATRYQKIKSKINSIKDIAHRIKKILKTTKHHYYVRKQSPMKNKM
ncbi:complement regulator-acquiring protein [Borrelia persica]|uniref:complement regulator-acquiring protein n=1 Tax=Borrelia persica TaxID=44448 RepID=UPI0004654F0C|nr:complement regulator-acquiring protein [Borrelia persica]